MKNLENLPNPSRLNLENWLFQLIFIFTIFLISINITLAQPIQTPTNDRMVSVNGKKFKHKPRITSQDRSVVCTNQVNRTIDGTCNNTSDDDRMLWGAADVELRREMEAGYGQPDFFNEMAGNCRLSPRAISNLVSDQSSSIESPRNLSSLVFTWGQFIDHDFTLTPEGESEYVPILLPADEPLFSLPIPFLRSEVAHGTGEVNDRQQSNIITSWLDGSQVYGSEQTRADWLRTFSGGKLKTSVGELLPYNTLTGNQDGLLDPNAPSMAGDGGGTSLIFVAGDVRAAEQPGLTALHTLFVREHNRLCDELMDNGQNNDEQNYQEARKIVGAYIQNITYQYFLPALGVQLSNYQNYDPNVQPDISNLFASAAYRLGHTMVTDEIPLIGEDCDDEGSLPLLEGFFNPQVIPTYGMETILQGLASQTQEKVDPLVVDNLRNFLFPVEGNPQAFGLDLVSLNIQRGRDHGLPDYLSVRNKYIGDEVNSFADITEDEAAQGNLETAYGSVYDMDLWVGLLSEDPLNGSSVGPTMHAILADQFERMRDGDRFYYLRDQSFSQRELDRIRGTSLKDIIERNTEINRLQRDVFYARDCGQGNGGGGPRPGPGGQGRPGPNSEEDTEIKDSNFDVQGSNRMDVGVSPNPTTGMSAVQVKFENEVEKVSITIRDLKGKELKKEVITLFDNSLFYDLDMSHLSSGVYLITIETEGTTYSERIVKE